MEVVRLVSETDISGWRRAARTLRSRGVVPEAALWTVDGDGTLIAPGAEPAADPAFTVPKAFVDLVDRVVLHRSDERFALLYRLLWRLRDEPDLLRIATDPDVVRAAGFAREVDRAAHKMKAFVRFRLAHDEAGEAYVAWFEPAHRVTEATAPFFVRRFANVRFSILTPDVCAHWNLKSLSFTPGVDPADAPHADALEAYWRIHHAQVFALPKETPQRDGRNLPEAGLIPELIAQAEGRTAQMVRQAPSEPSRRVVKAAVRASRDAPYDGQAPITLADVAAGVDHCRRCDLWREATQGVAGEGPAHAKLLFVGEQPGDQEDLAGRPFVGPAGQMFDRALAAAGVPRAETYVTNAVKHFKYEPRGKRRIHKTPDAGEVAACRWWLDAERRIIRPRVIVALGTTAGLAVMGKPTPIARLRQQALQLPDQGQAVVTYHPSYLLRVPDADRNQAAWDMFVADLAFAWRLAV
ncbi:MAG: UdgX family uracil-DNA binding protein [Pseudomonadota bacterium]